MTVENAAEEAAAESAEGQENDLIRSLRAQLKDAQSEAKEAKRAREAAVEAARAEVVREVKAHQLVSELGFPKMASLVAANVEGDLTAESVQAYLAELGVTEVQSDAPDAEGERRPDPAGVQQVADLGSSLATASRNDAASQSLIRRLGEAQSVEEVAALAAEGGFLQS